MSSKHTKATHEPHRTARRTSARQLRAAIKSPEKTSKIKKENKRKPYSERHSSIKSEDPYLAQIISEIIASYETKTPCTCVVQATDPSAPINHKSTCFDIKQNLLEIHSYFRRYMSQLQENGKIPAVPLREDDLLIRFINKLSYSRPQQNTPTNTNTITRTVSISINSQETQPVDKYSSTNSPISSQGKSRLAINQCQIIANSAQPLTLTKTIESRTVEEKSKTVTRLSLISNITKSSETDSTRENSAITTSQSLGSIERKDAKDCYLSSPNQKNEQSDLLKPEEAMSTKKARRRNRKKQTVQLVPPTQPSDQLALMLQSLTFNDEQRVQLCINTDTLKKMTQWYERL